MKYSETSYQMKQKLAAALETELTQTAFTSVTVRMIVERCGVNRKTFYYHFSDIHALLYWMLREHFNMLMHTEREMVDYVVLAEGVMGFVEQNEQVFLNLIGTAGEDGLKRVLEDGVHHLQEKVVTSFETCYAAHFEEDFRAFLVRFLTDAVVGILMDWIRRQEYHNHEHTIEYLRDIFRTTIPGLINGGIHLKSEK